MGRAASFSESVNRPLPPKKVFLVPERGRVEDEKKTTVLLPFM